MNRSTDGARSLTPEDVATLINAATAAPSVHNSQPWRFRDVADQIELHRDQRRVLPIADTDGRESTISCGAALLNLRLAMGALGHEPSVDVLPDPANLGHLATLTRGPAGAMTRSDAALYEAVPRRHSYRRPFGDEPVPAEVLNELETAAGLDGTALTAVRTPDDQLALIDLSSGAAQWLLGDPAYRGELSRWTRRQDSAPDGVSVGVMGDGQYPVNGLPWSLAADPEVALAELRAHPLLVLTTDGDEPADWLRAGQALQRVWLTATVRGLVASLFTQATELRPTREMLAHHLRLPGHPQLILRLGHPCHDVVHAGRRRLRTTFLPLAPR
jgi:nitroreductase